MENNEQPQEEPTSVKVSDQISTNVKIVIAFFLGAIIAGTLVNVALPFLSKYVNEILIVFVVLIGLLAILALIFTTYKEFFFKLFFGISKADLDDVQESSRSMVQNAIEKDWVAAGEDFNLVSKKGGVWYAWLSYRRWIVNVFYTLFLAFAGLLGSVLLYNQNELLEIQNTTLEKQNEKIDAQIELEESNRRGNLIVMMSNVMDEISRELQQKDNPSRKISEQLIGRISALSYAFRPYRFWQDSSLIATPLSPERGQLLLALVNSNLNSSTYEDIYRKATFTQASLDGAYLPETNLITALLNNAELSDATLIGAELNNAFLIEANLRGSYLQKTILCNATLTDADLRGAEWENTDLRKAKLNGVKVKELNWIEKLEGLEVKGMDSIRFHYEVDATVHKDTFGVYHILRLK